MTKRSRNIWLAGAAVLLLVLLFSPRLKLFDAVTSGAPPANQADGRIPVTAYLVKPEKIDNKIYSTGTVLANEEVELKSEISGKIDRILFREGSRVQKRQLLAKINDAELQAQLLKLESQQKLADDKEHRRKLLFEKGNISPEDYEITLNELKSIKAEVMLIKARIDKTEIRAPFDGIIGLRYVSEGSLVSPTSQIANLQDVNPVKVDFSIPEKYANSVRRDHAIRFKVAGSESEYAGKIYAIEPKIDPATRTVQIRALSPNPDGKVIPGAFAEVELVLDELASAFMIPSQALVPELQGQKVFVHKNGVVEPRSVEIGIRTETKVQVTEGLQENDTLITSGILQLRPGMPVRLTEMN